MNKQATFLLLSFLTLLSMTAPASGSTPKQQPSGQHELTLFFSNDVRGETEPCG